METKKETEDNIKKLEKQIEVAQKQIELIDSNAMITIAITGIVKQTVKKIIEVPINKTLQVNEYLFRDNQLKYDFIKQIKSKFPKGSVIEVKEVHDKLKEHLDKQKGGLNSSQP